MQLIECPWCGPREEVEFHYGGQAHVAYPPTRRRWTTASGPSTCSSATTPRACSASAGRTPPAAAAGSTPNATPSRTSSRGSTPAGEGNGGPVSTDTSPTAHAPFRTADGGRIDRSRVLEFRVGGQVLTAHPGDTVASALLAHGRHQVGTSIKLGRPRGIGAPGPRTRAGCCRSRNRSRSPCCSPRPSRCSTVSRSRGSRARAAWRRSRTPPATTAGTCTSTSSSSARGRRSAGRPDRRPGRGARGPRRRAVRGGGSLLGSTDVLDGAPATAWVARATPNSPGTPTSPTSSARPRSASTTTVRPRRRTPHRPPRRAGAGEPLPPAGAPHPRRARRRRHGGSRAARRLHRQRPPRTMLAGAARTFLHRYGVLPGSRAVVFTTNDSAYAAAVDLADAGVEVAAVVDVRRRLPPPGPRNSRSARSRCTPDRSSRGPAEPTG